jgi:tetratricopeptide (TPR) repeat protein
LPAKLPRPLRAVLERGLAFAPARRWPDLEALLAALERARGRRKRVAIACGAAAIVIGGAAAAFAVAPQPDTCGGSEAALASAWNPGTKLAGRAAFLATRAPYAAFAWQHAEQALDDYGRTWVAMRGEACRATERHEQSAGAMDLRMACLTQRLAEVRAAGDVFAHADADVVAKAPRVTAGLSPLDGCADLTALQAVVAPPNAAVAGVVAQTREELARIRVLGKAGHERDLLPAARAAVARAKAIAYPPLEAESLADAGELAENVDDPGAGQLLKEAFAAAVSSDDAGRAGGAAVELTSYYGLGRMDVHEGELWLQIARAETERRAADPRDRAALAEVAANLAFNAGRYDAAIAGMRDSLAQRQRLHDDLQIARGELALAGALMTLRRSTDAKPPLERALEIRERVFGPDHPAVAEVLAARAQLLTMSGEFAAAVTDARRALAIDETALGVETSAAAGLHFTIGVALGQLGERTALDELHRALAIDDKVRGPSHPLTIAVHDAIGDELMIEARYDEALVELREALQAKADNKQINEIEIARTRKAYAQALDAVGKHAEAIAELRRVSAVYERAFGATSNPVGSVRRMLGDALAHAGRFDEALRELHAAVAIEERTLGADHPDVSNALRSLGEAQLAMHDYRAAADSLARAVAILEAKAPRNPTLPSARAELAAARRKAR